MGGETYEVRSTGKRRTRPDRSRPRTPHHNSDAKKTWRYSTHKKTAGAVVRYVCQQAAKPGTRFMRCSGNVTRHDERWQAVFVLRADVVRMLRINITWQLVIVCIRGVFLMSDKLPSDYEILFDLWYSYWLEHMTSLLHRRASLVLRISAFLAIVAAFIFCDSATFVFASVVLFLVWQVMAASLSIRAEKAEWQALSYQRLISQRHVLTPECMIARLSFVEESDSPVMECMINLAWNKACETVGSSARNHVSISGRLLSRLCGF